MLDEVPGNAHGHLGVVGDRACGPSLPTRPWLEVAHLAVLGLHRLDRPPLDGTPESVTDGTADQRPSVLVGIIDRAGDQAEG